MNNQKPVVPVDPGPKPEGAKGSGERRIRRPPPARGVLCTACGGEFHGLTPCSLIDLQRQARERDAAFSQSIQAVLHPSMQLLCKLGSIAVHAEEGTSPQRHRFDIIALKNLLSDPEVMAWMEGMQKAAFLPVKR